MKLKTLVPYIILLTLAGCAAQEEKPEASVEDQSVTLGTDGSLDSSSDGGTSATTSGVGTDGSISLDPLEDPESQLSVRIIYFAYDSSEIRPEFRPAIEAHAQFLAANPDRIITLEGHADERGSREYNLALGERRANAVRRQMSLLGASAGQIRTVSYGEERPDVDGHDESAWSQNRRAIIIY